MLYGIDKDVLWRSAVLNVRERNAAGKKHKREWREQKPMKPTLPTIHEQQQPYLYTWWTAAAPTARWRAVRHSFRHATIREAIRRDT